VSGRCNNAASLTETAMQVFLDHKIEKTGIKIAEEFVWVVTRSFSFDEEENYSHSFMDNTCS